MTAPRSAAQMNMLNLWWMDFRPLDADGDAAARRPYPPQTILLPNGEAIVPAQPWAASLKGIHRVALL